MLCAIQVECRWRRKEVLVPLDPSSFPTSEFSERDWATKVPSSILD